MYKPYDFKENDAYDFARHVGIEAKPHNGELFFKICPYCRPKPTKDNIRSFSINLKTGQYKCLRASCGVSGNMITLSKDFDFSLGNEVDEYYRPKKQYKRIKTPKEPIIPKPKAVEYLINRGISEEVAKKYEITTQTDHDNILVFPFYDEKGILQFIKYRKSDYDKEKDTNKEWCEAGCKPILFGMKQCNDNFDRLVITEGQLDSLSVATAGIENAVSVPTGAKGFTWVPYCWNWINQFKEIVVLGDFEKGHITLLDELSRRLKITLKHVREDDYKGCKDANEILQKYGKEQIRECIENSVVVPIKQIVELADVENVDIFKLEKLKTGIKQLDKLLYGGFPFGGVVLISGKPGEGKLLADDTPVFTKYGWKNHGDLIVGDEVIGRYGEFVKVTHVFEKYFANMKVTLSNHETFYCHENHEWVVTTHGGNSYTERILTTKEIFDMKESGYKAPIRIITRKPLSKVKGYESRNVTIRAIEYCEHKQGNCVQVDGGIYCVGRSMTPTHNSTLASQIIVNAMEQDYKCFAYSGELPNYLFKAWMDFQVAGSRHIFDYKNQWGDKNYEISKTNRCLISEWYRGKTFLYDNGSIDGDEKESLISTIENSIMQYGVRVILLDNLMTAIDLESVKGDDKYDKQSNFIKRLTKIALTYDVLILLVAHKRKNNFSKNENDEISGSGDIANLALITVAYEKSTDIDESQRLMIVSKNRLFGKVNTSGWTLDYDDKSKRIYGLGDDLNREYGWNNNIDDGDGFEAVEEETPFD